MHINELHVRILHYFKVVGKQLSGRNQLTRKKKELGNKLLSIVQRKKKPVGAVPHEITKKIRELSRKLLQFIK